MNIDIQAAGTWMKMMRYASPCCASVGATTRPSHNPTPASSAAGTENHHAIRTASGKNDACEAKRNQLIKRALISIQSNTNRGGGGERRTSHCREQRGSQHRELPTRTQSGARRFDCTGAEDEDGNVQRQDQERQQRAAAEQSQNERR